MKKYTLNNLVSKHIIYILVILGSLQCKTGSENIWETDYYRINSGEKFFKSSKDVISRYDESIKQIFKKEIIDKEYANDLKFLEKAYNENCVWAKVNNDDNQIISLTSGTPSIIIAIYEPDNPILKQPRNTMFTVNQHGQTIIQIRPDIISQEYAGIFLIHELVHAVDFSTNTKSFSSDFNEMKAYFQEKYISNIYFNGKYDEALDNILKMFKINNFHDFLEARSTDNKRYTFDNELMKIDKFIGASKPESNAEAEMRLGFYLVSLEIRRQEILNLKNHADKLDPANIRILINMTSKYTNINNH